MEKNYSHRTLVQKLGIKDGHAVLLIHIPEDYKELVTDLPKKVAVYKTEFEQLNAMTGSFDIAQLFVQSQERLKEVFPIVKKLLRKNGMLWVSWPKGHCDIRSNLNENIVRNIGLKNGLVDVKVISINEYWSGLKFVYRLSERG